METVNKVIWEEMGSQSRLNKLLGALKIIRKSNLRSGGADYWLPLLTCKIQLSKGSRASTTKYSVMRAVWLPAS